LNWLNGVLWDVMACSLVETCKYFMGTCCFYCENGDGDDGSSVFCSITMYLSD